MNTREFDLDWTWTLRLLRRRSFSFWFLLLDPRMETTTTTKTTKTTKNKRNACTRGEYAFARSTAWCGDTRQ